MSKKTLQKPRYEYYKGTIAVVDNELDSFVDDVAYRLNAQDFYKRRLLKEKQNQDQQIATLQHRLDVAEKAIDLMIDIHCNKSRPDLELNLRRFVFRKGIVDFIKEQAEKELEEDNKIGDFWHSAYQGKQLEYDQVYAELRKAYEENQQLKQSQKQLAIEELEKVKEKLVEDRNNAQVLLDPIEQEDYHELIGVIRGYRNSIYEVQEQIKELGGVENE